MTRWMGQKVWESKVSGIRSGFDLGIAALEERDPQLKREMAEACERTILAWREACNIKERGA